MRLGCNGGQHVAERRTNPVNSGGNGIREEIVRTIANFLIEAVRQRVRVHLTRLYKGR